jgi:hypothetical protein
MTRDELRADQRKYAGERDGRIYVPQRTDSGLVLTSDNRLYGVDRRSGSMRRRVPKVRGKAARRADKLQRRKTLAAPVSRDTAAHVEVRHADVAAPGAVAGGSRPRPLIPPPAMGGR